MVDTTMMTGYGVEGKLFATGNKASQSIQAQSLELGSSWPVELPVDVTGRLWWLS